MPSNLDLDRIKAALNDAPSQFYPEHPEFVPWHADEHYLTVEACEVLNAAPALVAEVERLTQELATAKAVGAAEELERMASTVWQEVGPFMTLACLKNRAAELRKGIK